MTGEFLEGYLTCETFCTDSIGEEGIDWSSYQDGYLAFSDAEERFDPKRHTPAQLEEWCTGPAAGRGFLMGIHLWGSPAPGVNLELSAERGDCGFCIGTWHLETETAPSAGRPPNCYYAPAATMAGKAALKNDNLGFSKDLQSLEIIVPQYRRHLFMITGET